MYIKSLSVKNLRCFRKIEEMKFQFPGRDPKNGPTLDNINLLLGNNGAGKTSVLKGIALAMIAPVAQNAGLRPYNLVRRIYDGGRGRRPEKLIIESQVILTAQDIHRDQSKRKSLADLYIRINRKGDNDYIEDATKKTRIWHAMDFDNSPSFLVLGYGATRRMAPSKENISSRSKESHLRYQRLRSLFEEDFSLVPLSFWLQKHPDPKLRGQVIHLLDKLLDNEYHFSGKLENEEYVFERDGALVPLPALSDGFRAFIAWVSDMLYHVSKGVHSNKKLEEVEGIVMVDEIDLHLHPRWQQTIIKTLSHTFPKVQFIFTSHSPLITGSLEWNNVWVMNENTPTQLPDEPIYGLSADQVLQSRYFNLTSSRPPEVASELRELDKKAQAGNKEAGVELMQRLAQGSEKRVYKRTSTSSKESIAPPAETAKGRHKK